MKASDLLKEGTIGKPFHAMANYWEAIGYSTFLDRENFFTNWRFDPVTAGGGILMDGMTHWIRPLTLWYATLNMLPLHQVKTLNYCQEVLFFAEVLLRVLSEFAL